MRTGLVSHTLLLDHDNLKLDGARLASLLYAWIDAADGLRSGPGPTHLRVRAYGGWFAGAYTSDARHRASEFYSEAVPSVFRYRGAYYSLSFEFADGLIGAPAQASVRITHSVVRRNTAITVALKAQATPCPEQDCELRLTKKWLRLHRACKRTGCPLEFSDCFERVEQKQVDVHVAVDLLWLVANNDGQIAIASDDADFLPAIASAALTGRATNRLTVLRFNCQALYMDGFLNEHHIRIALVQQPGAAS